MNKVLLFIFTLAFIVYCDSLTDYIKYASENDGTKGAPILFVRNIVIRVKNGTTYPSLTVKPQNYKYNDNDTFEIRFDYYTYKNTTPNTVIVKLKYHRDNKNDTASNKCTMYEDVVHNKILFARYLYNKTKSEYIPNINLDNEFRFVFVNKN